VERTDMPPGMSYRHAARKVVAMCVSDFAAKGVRPDSFMVSLGLRRGISSSQVRELAKGFVDAQREWGVRMVGGDTNEAGELVIDCAMIGFADRVVGRDGARPGDLVVVTGPFGFTSSGLRILIGGARASKSFRKKAVESVLRPSPNLEGGVALAPYMNSSLDSSDGLARSLHIICDAGDVGIELNLLPAGRGVTAFAKANSLDPERLVLAGGEEYVVVGTLTPESLSRAKRTLDRVRGELLVIGRVTNRRGEVTLRVGRSTRRINDEGWTHLR